MFVGEKLTDIRVLHGYSRNELAIALDVTEQAVWQFENGYATPGIETMSKIKQLFNVKNLFFYNDSSIGETVKEEGIAYRSSEKNNAKRTKTEAVYLRFINYLMEYIEDFVEYPDNLILKLRDYTINQIIEEGQVTERLIKEIAIETRNILGLNNQDNKNLLFLLEKNGLFIVERDLSVKTDAYSSWLNNNRPIIVLSNFKKSSVRRNFDLAHELGHLLLHYKINILELTTTEYEKIESEANLFAANFLLPEDLFLNDMKSVKRKSNPNSYIELKEKWHVSIAALAYRAYQLNLLSYQQYRYFNGLLNKHGYRVQEPLDDTIPIIRPGKLRNSLRYIFENNLSDLNDFQKHTSFEIKLISKLFGIEEEFFSKYSVQPKIYNFKKRVK
ncbi:Zn-dependent peptidase ImmA, M78 family [Bacillus altitudinis]|uniref:spr1629 family repressor/antitoxin n=1 Tax=Bacillus altitudinis TaxID=293387 RepID=UPI00091AA63B|nr:XRE family transcriptional regulator [Bacillus altitudinis]SFX28373.1 Zn-dependent peptidase ImmA, M78 family [Bacillus altitudinis]SNS02277.1 Zn-dependent peptidase ImmA, M78 family [Bacillus altitudinis]